MQSREGYGERMYHSGILHIYSHNNFLDVSVCYGYLYLFSSKVFFVCVRYNRSFVFVSNGVVCPPQVQREGRKQREATRGQT